MNKLFFSARKEVLLIVRDIPGLMILFLMPVLLMTVVIFAQEYTLRTQPGKTVLLFIDESHSDFSRSLSDNLIKSGFFKTDTTINGMQLSPGKAKELITSGKYHFGLYISAGDSSIEIISDPAISGPWNSTIITSLKYIVNGTRSRSIVEKMLAVSAGDMKPLIDKVIGESMNKFPPVKETWAGTDSREIKPSAIQNTCSGFHPVCHVLHSHSPGFKYYQ